MNECFTGEWANALGSTPNVRDENPSGSPPRIRALSVAIPAVMGNRRERRFLKCPFLLPSGECCSIGFTITATRNPGTRFDCTVPRAGHFTPTQIRKAKMERQQFLRINDVVSMTRLSRSSIYGMMRAGEFPRSRRTGKQSVAWLESEINAWMESRPVADPMDWHSPNRQVDSTAP